MKLLVTGATGFLGRYVVTEAIRRGHEVRAVARPSAEVGQLDWYARDRVELVRADLRSLRGLADVVRGVDWVLHLAAAKQGDLYAQYAGTVVATENLLAAMTETGVHRIVAISSFSVYNYARMHPFALLDEQSPVESDAFDRDEYAQTKLVQERVIREHAAPEGLDLVVLRPGVIWGRDNLLNAWIGIPAGKRLWLRTGAWATVPLVYVENCAEAIVLAAETKAAIGQTLNVVDDELPSQRRFAQLIFNQMHDRPLVIPISYGLLRLISGAVWQVNKRFLGGRAKIPGLFIPSRLQARAKPLRYSNRQLKQILGWKPRYTLAEGLKRIVSGQSDTRAPQKRLPIEVLAQ